MRERERGGGAQYVEYVENLSGETNCVTVTLKFSIQNIYVYVNVNV